MSREEDRTSRNRAPTDRRLRSAMAELDEALGRPRPPSLPPPPRGGQRASQKTRTPPTGRWLGRAPGDWVDALKVRGVPASLQDGQVVVDEIGPVPLPLPKQSLKSAANGSSPIKPRHAVSG